jgi:hypothetical protein
MARKKSEKQEDVKIWTEDELKEQTGEQLAEIAEEFGISSDNTAEQIINDILEAQIEKDDATPPISEEKPEIPKEDTPDIPKKPEGDGKIEIVVTSEKRKGKTIFAVSGNPIVFDNEGRAKVGIKDAEYLKNCPGFTFE